MSLPFNQRCEVESRLELFWLLAGVLSTVAALFLLLPWLRTIPRLGPLPAVSWPVLALAAVVLAGVVGLYLKLGRPELLARSRASAGAAIAVPAAGGRAAAAASSGAAGSMAAAIASLEARLAKGGGSADDWELLAKSYEFLGRPADAAQARAGHLPALPSSAPADAAMGATAGGAGTVAASAAAPVLTAQSLKLLAQANAARRSRKPAAAAAIYARLAASGQMNADSWADYADTAASLQGGRLAGDAQTYIARALALDPRHPKALWLQASADEEAGRFNDAIGVWQRLLAVLEPNSADARIVTANLQQDLKLYGASAPAAAPVATASTTMTPAAMTPGAMTPGAIPRAAAASGVTLSGTVALADALRSKVANGETLFIVAKSVDAPGIPVAVYRGAVGAWPASFRLDDSLAMMPGRNLSSAGRVTVEARISKSGQAMPASGDLSGTSPVVDPAGSKSLQILIDRVIP